MVTYLHVKKVTSRNSMQNCSMRMVRAHMKFVSEGDVRDRESRPLSSQARYYRV